MCREAIGSLPWGKCRWNKTCGQFKLYYSSSRSYGELLLYCIYFLSLASKLRKFIVKILPKFIWNKIGVMYILSHKEWNIGFHVWGDDFVVQPEGRVQDRSGIDLLYHQFSTYVFETTWLTIALVLLNVPAGSHLFRLIITNARKCLQIVRLAKQLPKGELKPSEKVDIAEPSGDDLNEDDLTWEVSITVT